MFLIILWGLYKNYSSFWLFGELNVCLKPVLKYSLAVITIIRMIAFFPPRADINLGKCLT